MNKLCPYCNKEINNYSEVSGEYRGCGTVSSDFLAFCPGYWEFHSVRPICPGCSKEIDPDVCWCGDLIDNHGYDGHFAVPMGCNCHRAK